MRQRLGGLFAAVDGMMRIICIYRYGVSFPSFDRSPENGFRCVKYIDKEKIPKSALRQIEYSGVRDFSKEEPVPENIFKIYKNQFLYDNTDLKAVIEERDESPEDWIVEKITFNAAYGDERMIAYLIFTKKWDTPFSDTHVFPRFICHLGKRSKKSEALNGLWIIF